MLDEAAAATGTEMCNGVPCWDPDDLSQQMFWAAKQDPPSCSAHEALLLPIGHDAAGSEMVHVGGLGQLLVRDFHPDGAILPLPDPFRQGDENLRQPLLRGKTNESEMRGGIPGEIVHAQ